MRVLPILMSLLLAACTAPGAQGGAGLHQTDAAHPQRSSPQARTGKPVKMPPLGGPLPPERVQGYCEADADCSVRTARNGCATCVGRGDAAEALPSGGAATCGMQETDGCRCIDHRCAAKPRMIDSPIQQAAPERDTP